MLTVAFAMGFATTAAEPDVLVLAGQAEAAAQGTWSAQPLVYIISAGVGLFVAVAMLLVVLDGVAANGYLIGDDPAVVAGTVVARASRV